MRHKSWRAATALLLGALFLFTLSGAALAAPPWLDAQNQFWVHTYGVTSIQAGTVAAGYAAGSVDVRAITPAEASAWRSPVLRDDCLSTLFLSAVRPI